VSIRRPSAHRRTTASYAKGQSFEGHWQAPRLRTRRFRAFPVPHLHVSARSNALYRSRSPAVNEAIEKFREAAEPLLGDYQSIEVYLIAFRWRKYWLNLATRAVLDPREPRSFKFLGHKGLRELIVDADVVPVSELDRLTGAFETGRIEWKGTTVCCARVEQGEPRLPYTPYYRRYPRVWSERNLGIDVHCHALSGWDSTMHSTIGADGFAILQSDVASLPRPYRGVGDLVRSHVGREDVDNESAGSILEILAPAWLCFDSSSLLQSGKVNVKAVMREGLQPGDASVGVVQSNGAGVVRRGRTGLKVDGRKKAGWVALAVEMPLDTRAEMVSLLLSYRGELVDERDLHLNIQGRLNPRMQSYKAIDPELRQFQEALLGKAKDPGRAFERAFLALFSFLGFSCIHIGDNERNPDVLAWGLDPALVFVVECTIGEPDLRNKATKFSARLRHARAFSPASNVVGLLATVLKQEMVNPADRDRLRNDRVVLIDAECIQRLLQLANRGRSVDEAIEFLQQMARTQGLESWKRVRP